MKGNFAQVLDGTTITYRQLQYWISQGWLRPEGSGGSGNAFIWSDEEVAVARTMGRLVDAGLAPSVAAKVARGHVVVAPGIRVEVLDMAEVAA